MLPAGRTNANDTHHSLPVLDRSSQSLQMAHAHVMFPYQLVGKPVTPSE